MGIKSISVEKRNGPDIHQDRLPTGNPQSLYKYTNLLEGQQVILGQVICSPFNMSSGWPEDLEGGYLYSDGDAEVVKT